MCKVGDVILITEYLDELGIPVSRHPFVVIEDEAGKIGGISFDFVCNAMSSIKNKEHLNKILKNKANVPVTVEDGVKKDSYIKADVLYYFDKSKIDFIVVSVLTEEIMDLLFEIIEILDCRDALRQNTKNLVNC